MNNENNNYEEKIMSIIGDYNDLNIYVDNVNGKYAYKRVGNEAFSYKYIDRIETDGFFVEENKNSCFLEGANYAIIRTYDGMEIKRTSVILSPMAYGIVSSYVLCKGNEEIIEKLENSKMGNLENFKLSDDHSYFAICPEIESISLVRKL